MPAWAWALIAFGAATICGVLVLSVPVDVRFYVARPAERSAQFRLEWLWGAVGKSFSGRTGAKRTARPEPPERRTHPRRKRRGAMPGTGLIIGMLGALRRSARGIAVKRLKVNVVFGSPDAAETGLICALVFPVVAAAQPLLGKAEIEIQPDFDRERLEYEVDGWVRVSPLRIIVPFVAFGLRPSTLADLAEMRRAAA